MKLLRSSLPLGGLWLSLLLLCSFSIQHEVPKKPRSTQAQRVQKKLGRLQHRLQQAKPQKQQRIQQKIQRLAPKTEELNGVYSYLGFSLSVAFIIALVLLIFLFLGDLIFSILFVIVLGIGALGFSLTGFLLAIHQPERYGKKGWALAGLIISGIVFFFYIVINFILLLLFI